MTIFYFLIMIGVLVSIHEAGHMFVGKLFGLYVREFAIGFGPTIFSKQGKETKYSLRLIPLGGFTGFIESEDENNPDENEIKIPESRTLYGASPLKRIAVYVAGPLCNIILACIIFAGIFVASPYKVVYPEAIVSSLMQGYPAQEAGIQVGDKIVQIEYSNGEIATISNINDISVNNALHSGSMKVTVERDDQLITVEVTPKYSEEDENYLIGVQFNAQYTYVEMTTLEAVGYGVSYAFQSIGVTIKSIINMISGQVGLNNLSGTIGIYSYTEEAVSYGFLSYLSLVGSLSISLAVMNMIPIPVFDGGRVFMTLIEMVMGHRLSKKVEEVMMIIGLVLILGLFILTTVLDVSKLIG